jgi:hypothetical protein
MPPAIKRLADVGIGSTVLLPCRLTARSAAGATLETLNKDAEAWTVTGSFTIAVPSGTVAGAWTTDPRDQLVRVVALAMAVGDVVRNDGTGETLVVQAVNLGPDGTLWSTSTAGRPTYESVGWAKVGTATIP